jgi:hypothetical protein
MRSISPAGLAKLAQSHGTEPISIVAIDWTAGKSQLYADRTVASIPGKILELSEVDDATSLAGNSSTSSATVTLDDTDGTIKAILDAHDVHKRPARVYQYFDGLDLSDKFLVFTGVVMTPVVWNERERTVTLSIVSKLEDQECGYTTEQRFSGILPSNVPNSPWPMIFGTVTNNKAARLQTPVSGTTLDAVGVLGGAEALLECPDDPGLAFTLSIRKSESQTIFLQQLIDRYQVAYNDATDNADMMRDHSTSNAADLLRTTYAPGVKINATTDSERASLAAADIAVAAIFTQAAANYNQVIVGYQQQLRELQVQIQRRLIEFDVQRILTREKRQIQIDQARLQGYGANPVEILGGASFPQGQVTANINGAIFTGTMSGDELTITNRQSAYLEALANGILNKMTNGEELVAAPVTVNLPNADGTVTGMTYYADNQGVVSDTWQWSARVPVGCDGQQWTVYTTLPEQMTVQENASCYNYDSILQHMWIDPGASVQIISDAALRYVASITPGVVKSVRAPCNVNGVQLLVDVPDYEIVHESYRTELGRPLTATIVKLPQLLSSRIGEQWSDDLYVTFESSIGPDVAEILRWLIDTFGDVTCDTASFNACHVPYPANFALNSNRNLLGVLQDIAFQACCRLSIEDNVVHVTYLPTRPEPVDTITESDVDAETGIEVSLTSSEELLTRMSVNWSELPAPELETVNERTWNGATYANRWVTGSDAGDLQNPSYNLVLRSNIAKYGVHAVSHNFTIYNARSSVLACAHFWLRRKSHTWKRVKFTTPLHKLNLETFDAVTLDFQQPHVAAAPVLALIESAKYDSASNCIHFECITPVLAGTATDCGFFWEA